MISVSFWEKMNAAYHDMVDLKVSLGYSALTYTAAHILPFLEYGTAAFPNAEEITKEMLDSWLTVREFATDNTRKHVIINLRHFTRYLNAVGYTAFVPTEDYNIKIQRYQPYIFTDLELQCLFDAIDDVKPCARSHAELILPVLFRLELCCGMRPNEPLSLRTEDVDLRSGDIFIRKSKRGIYGRNAAGNGCAMAWALSNGNFSDLCQRHYSLEPLPGLCPPDMIIIAYLC